MTVLAGILDILSGGIMLVMAVLVLTIPYDEGADEFADAVPYFLALAVFVTILAILAIVGGICALRRRRWRLALAGSFAACMSPPQGIAALGLTMLSRDEFDQSPSTRQRGGKTTIICRSCGTELPNDAVFCVKCGSEMGDRVRPEKFMLPDTPIVKETVNRERGRKSEGTATVLALLFGLVGLFGIGHFYAGYLGKAFMFLFLGFLLTCGWLFLVAVLVQRQEVEGGSLLAIVSAAVVYVLGIGIWAWQTMDARGCVQDYNEGIGLSV